jgi:hypothetical protein
MTLAGFFDLAAVARFDADRAGAYGKLRCAPNQHLTLCDASGMKIQTQEVVAAFVQLVGNPRYVSRRLAIVTGSSLARMQTKRTTDRENVAFFTDLPAARAWLFASDERSAAA